jgi:hypothetical protein
MVGFFCIARPAISAASLARIMRAGVELYRPRMRQTDPMADGAE